MALKTTNTLLSAFMINLFEYGTLKSFGVFFGPLLQGFQTRNVVLSTWIAACRACINIICKLYKNYVSIENKHKSKLSVMSFVVI